MIQYALFRWESAVIVAGAILLSFFLPQPFPGWPIWGWAALGVVGVALIVYTSLTDPETNARVVASLFRERFNPREIRDRELRERVEQALDYHERAEMLVYRQRKGVLRDHLLDTTSQLADWLSSIFQLARQIDAYRSDPIIRRDRANVPEEIRRLREAREREDDPQVRAQLEATLAQREQQWKSLEALDNTIDRARYQLESTISALGTIYSQIALIEAKDIDSGRAQRLREDIAGQVQALQDIVQTIEELYRQPASEAASAEAGRI